MLIVIDSIIASVWIEIHRFFPRLYTALFDRYIYIYIYLLFSGPFSKLKEMLKLSL